MINQKGKVYAEHDVQEIVPEEAYEKLISSTRCFLVDVRSKAEWSFVGIPDSSRMKNDVIFCEWASFPKMERNLEFSENLLSHLILDDSDSIYFLCRSGARSFNAALEVTRFIQKYKTEFSGVSCLNVKYGFEGDLSADFKRGRVNGWKHSNLPWQQL
ncbi:MAG: rhodanese-like domain-containing protein [Paracoccaceae bacterium]